MRLDYQNQLSRRNLEQSQKAMLYATQNDLVAEIEKKAAERKAQAPGQPQGAKKSLSVVPRQELEQGKTAKVLAAAVGVGSTTMEKAMKIVKEGTPNRWRR